MMDLVVAFGSASLGLVVGLFAGWFANEEQPFTANNLASAVAVITSAGVIGLFAYLSKGSVLREIWLYPVGLLVGVLIAPPLDVMYTRMYENEKKRNTQAAKGSGKPLE